MLCTIYGILSHKTVEKSRFWRFTLFCRDFFAVIYVLLCGEKLSQKLCLWRKKDKYHVCHHQQRLWTDSFFWLLLFLKITYMWRRNCCRRNITSHHSFFISLTYLTSLAWRLFTLFPKGVWWKVNFQNVGKLTFLQLGKNPGLVNPYSQVGALSLNIHHEGLGMRILLSH